jgi:hypothetical protein
MPRPLMNRSCVVNTKQASHTAPFTTHIAVILPEDADLGVGATYGEAIKEEEELGHCGTIFSCTRT